MVALYYTGSHRKHAVWMCRCDCGTEKQVSAQGWGRSGTKSCGCILLEKNRSRPVRGQTNLVHGESGTKSSKRSSEYISWASMQQRCYNQKHSTYANYGGKGVSVCDKWRQSFQSFLLDMGRKPFQGASIDRIDVLGNYTPDNCRWASSTQQNTNRTNNTHVVISGNRSTISEASRMVRIPQRTISNWRKKVAPSEDITALVSTRLISAKPLGGF